MQAVEDREKKGEGSICIFYVLICVCPEPSYKTGLMAAENIWNRKMFLLDVLTVCNNNM